MKNRVLMAMGISGKMVLTVLAIVLCAGLGFILILNGMGAIAAAADEGVQDSGWTITSYQDVNEAVYTGAKAEAFDVNGKSLGFYKTDFLEQVKMDGAGKGDGNQNSGQFLHYDNNLDDGETYYLVNRSLGAYNNTLIPWDGERPSIAINPPIYDRCTRIQFVDLGPLGSDNPDWVIALLKNTTFYVDDKFTAVDEKKIDIYVGLQKTKDMIGTPESLWMTDAVVRILPPSCAPTDNVSTNPKSYNRLTVDAKDGSGNKMDDATIEIYDLNGVLLLRANSTTSADSMDLASDGKYSIKYLMPSGDTLVISNLVLAKNITLGPQLFSNYTGLLPAYTEPRSAVIALEDSEISGYSAEVTLKLNSSQANRILHCTSWSYSGARCGNWESKPTSDYDAYSDGSSIRFTVASFDAYLAGYYDAPATCSDGIQNQGEPGFDCGGPCTACYVPSGGGGGSSGGSGTGTGGGGGSGPAVVPSVIKLNASAKIVPYPREFEIVSGVKPDFKIIVENTGKSSIKNISIEFDNTWFSPDSKRISLASGESKTIQVIVDVPESANPGQYTAKVYLKGGASVAASFSFIVPEKEEKITAKISQAGIESAGNGIDALKKRIQQSNSSGYNTTLAEEFAAKADGAYGAGAVLEASDYVSKANAALDGAVKDIDAEKKLSLPYVFAVVILCILFISYAIVRSNKEMAGVNPDEANSELPGETAGKEAAS